MVFDTEIVDVVLVEMCAHLSDNIKNQMINSGYELSEFLDEKYKKSRWLTNKTEPIPDIYNIYKTCSDDYLYNRTDMHLINAIKSGMKSEKSYRNSMMYKDIHEEQFEDGYICKREYTYKIINIYREQIPYCEIRNYGDDYHTEYLYFDEVRFKKDLINNIIDSDIPLEEKLFKIKELNNTLLESTIRLT
jgi:hypothetical protein